MSEGVLDRPLFRWAGSKKKLLPHLKRLWRPQHNRYLEAFAGSACLFFSLGPKKALLNDRNRHVIGVYRAVRDHAKEVHEIVHSLPRTSDFYYRIRPIALGITDPVLRAALFLYLNRNCFNGLFRTNKFGQFNVPYSGDRTGSLPTSECFFEIGKYLKRARLSSLDFQDFVLKNVIAGDFVYLDPPYALENERIFTQYGLTTFGVADLKRLNDVLHHINDEGATFVLSYSDSDLARRIFARWAVDDVSVVRQIASFAANRRNVSELIITNAATSRVYR